MMNAARSQSRPLYQRVVDDIMAQIEAGQWRAGDKLPSERNLCEIYSVSQITVRRALRELTHAGRVYSHHGLGWFVSEETPSERLWSDVVLILPELDAFVTPIVQSLIEQLSRNHVTLQLALTDGTPESEEEALESAVRRQVQAGLVVVHGPERQVGSHFRRLLQKSDIPLVLLLREVTGVSAPAAVLDETESMQVVTEHILGLGHQRIAYAGTDPSFIEGQKRYWGFASTLWEHSLELPFSWVFAGSLTAEHEKTRFRQAFEDPAHPTALVCASDIRAGEAMSLLDGLGLRCPRDVAVVGLGDYEMAPWLPTPLTTFHFDLTSLGDAAATMTLALLAGGPVENVHVSGQLVIRKSCGAA